MSHASDTGDGLETTGPRDAEPPIQIDSVRGIVAAAAFALLAGDLLLTDVAPVLLSVAAGTALALAIPGYAVSRALFIHVSLDRAERTVLAIGLSLCVAILGGFALNALPDGINAHAWAIYLTSVSLVACAVAAVRHGLARKTGHPAAIVTTAEGRPARLPKAQLAMLVLAALLVISSFLVAQLGVAGQPQPGFTDLWLLPAAEGVTTGVTNHEGTATTYRLVLGVDGHEAASWSSGAIADGDSWQTEYAIETSPTTHADVTVALYRATDATPYRQAHLTIGRESIGAFPTTAPSP